LKALGLNSKYTLDKRTRAVNPQPEDVRGGVRKREKDNKRGGI